MEESIEDVLTLWAFHHCPLILQDDDLFDALLRFIHAVLRLERSAATRRAVRPSDT